jgi:hypothetical protein
MTERIPGVNDLVMRAKLMRVTAHEDAPTGRSAVNLEDHTGPRTAAFSFVPGEVRKTTSLPVNA